MVAARNGGLPKRYAQAKIHLLRRFAAPLIRYDQEAALTGNHINNN